MEIVVQKYGGTSVSTQESRDKIAENAVKLKGEGKYPVIVVSAMGRKGAPYATDTLISLFENAELEKNSREMDMLMSCGEIISSCVVANAIKNKGYKAIALTGFQAGIITDAVHGDATVVAVDTKKLQGHLAEDFIPVVTGFQGIDEAGDITTLGRGGSDNTAAILGEALNASSIEIFTDVDGIMTADPRVVEDANVIDEIGYDEIYRLATYGAKVVDYKAVEVARRSGKILRIRNTYSDAEGTSIKRIDTTADRNVIRAITSTDDVVQYSLEPAEDHVYEKMMIEIEQKEIEIDLINFSDKQKIFSVRNKDVDVLNTILEHNALEYITLDGCSKVTVIGRGIAGTPIFKRIVMALSKAKIEIIQTADSNTSISCLLNVKESKDALNILHKEFQL